MGPNRNPFEWQPKLRWVADCKVRCIHFNWVIALGSAGTYLPCVARDRFSSIAEFQRAANPPGNQFVSLSPFHPSAFSPPRNSANVTKPSYLCHL